MKKLSVTADELFRDRGRLFGILNITGWIGYMATAWLGALAHEKPESYFAVIAATAITGFLITLPMRALYRRLWSRSPVVLAIGLIVTCYTIALGWETLQTIRLPRSPVIGKPDYRDFRLTLYDEACLIRDDMSDRPDRKQL